MSEEKKQLNNEELEKVTGGHGIGENNPNYEGFSGYVGMYDLKKDGEYYFTWKDSSGLNWFRGVVIDTYEDPIGRYSKRQHKVRSTDQGNAAKLYACNNIVTLNGDNNAVYTTKNF